MNISALYASFCSLIRLLLFQSFCSACRCFLFTKQVLCNSCIQQIQPVACVKKAVTKTKEMTVFAISAYQHPLKKLILSKSRSDIVVSKQLGELVWSMTPIRTGSFDIIVPVPLHWTRASWRGYNQADQMAQVIAQKSGKQIVHAVRRVRKTKYQSSCSKENRYANVSGVFVLSLQASLLKGKRILLVDDLMTTGATLQEIARELLKGKPASITAVVACRVI